ncbi:MAG TPA: hypothetical protein VGO77_02250 [Mycobacterium sp.]|jgi:hypothetical protein|nr:hypothetical protein [Mycobacterium sp.]
MTPRYTVAARWLDDGIAPNGASGREFTTGSVVSVCGDPHLRTHVIVPNRYGRPTT